MNDALAITYNRLYIVIFTVIVFSLIQLVFERTRIGLDIRAVSQNRAMANAMGIRTEWVGAMTFGLGSGIAGVAGVALSQLTNAGPNLGQAYIILKKADGSDLRVKAGSAKRGLPTCFRRFWPESRGLSPFAPHDTLRNAASPIG